MKIEKYLSRIYPSSELSASAGLTLVEIVIAMALTTVMCAGLFGVGLQARHLAEYNRMATEAGSLAKEQLEEMISLGRVNLAQPSCTLTKVSTNTSSLGYSVVRTPRVIWHAADGSVVAASNSVYAEVHVDISFNTLMLKNKNEVNTYSTIIQ